jgi:hypothetical protein
VVFWASCWRGSSAWPPPGLLPRCCPCRAGSTGCNCSGCHWRSPSAGPTSEPSMACSPRSPRSSSGGDWRCACMASSSRPRAPPRDGSLPARRAAVVRSRWGPRCARSSRRASATLPSSAKVRSAASVPSAPSALCSLVSSVSSPCAPAACCVSRRCAASSRQRIRRAPARRWRPSAPTRWRAGWSRPWRTCSSPSSCRIDQPPPYDVLVDRISHDVPCYQPVLKLAACLARASSTTPSGASPTTSSSVHRPRRALGVAVPKTVVLPSKASRRRHHLRLAAQPRNTRSTG